MPRVKFHTLTEQMFYTLLCLTEECCGMDILYTLLEQFLEAGMIRETRVEGRRRSYILTDRGREMLRQEYERLCAQAADYRRIFGEEERE